MKFCNLIILNSLFSCPSHEIIALHELWRPLSWQLPTSGQGSHAVNYGNRSGNSRARLEGPGGYQCHNMIQNKKPIGPVPGWKQTIIWRQLNLWRLIHKDSQSHKSGAWRLPNLLGMASGSNSYAPQRNQQLQESTTCWLVVKKNANYIIVKLLNVCWRMSSNPQKQDFLWTDTRYVLGKGCIPVISSEPVFSFWGLEITSKSLGGFLKWGYIPQIIHFHRLFHDTPTILGDPNLWNPLGFVTVVTTTQQRFRLNGRFAGCWDTSSRIPNAHPPGRDGLPSGYLT